MRQAFGLVLFGLLACAQNRDVAYQGFLTPLNMTPTFDHGYLAVYDWDSKLDVYGPEGTLRYKVSVKLPDGYRGFVENGSVDTDGTLAMAFKAASDGRPQFGGIALFSSTGEQQRVIQTPNYWPTQVAFGPDHSIWTIGSLGNRISDASDDYMILRRYSREGVESGRFLARSSFPYTKGQGPAGIVQPVVMSMIGGWELHVTRDHVDIVIHHYNLWIETDLNGVEKGRWDIGANRRPVAITDDGRAWRIDGPDLKVFDRIKGEWRTVPFTFFTGRYLLGAEGNDLVFQYRYSDMLVRALAPE